MIQIEDLHFLKKGKKRGGNVFGKGSRGLPLGNQRADQSKKSNQGKQHDGQLNGRKKRPDAGFFFGQKRLLPLFDLFLMAPGAFPGGKGLGPVVTDAAGFSAKHIRHHHFCFSLFHGKRSGMAGGAGKPTMAFVMEVHVFPGRLIFQGIGPAGFGRRLILMAAVAVVKGRSILFGMAGNTRLPVPVIVKINLRGPLPVGKRPGMTDLASSLELVASMPERDGFRPLAEMDGFPGSGDGFPVAAAAIAPGKGVFVPAAVAAKAKPAAAVVRHTDPGGSFAGFEQGSLANTG